jgi:hypothetical protein
MAAIRAGNLNLIDPEVHADPKESTFFFGLHCVDSACTLSHSGRFSPGAAACLVISIECADLLIGNQRADHRLAFTVQYLSGDSRQHAL